MGMSAHGAHARHVRHYLIEKLGKDYEINLGYRIAVEASHNKSHHYLAALVKQWKN